MSDMILKLVSRLIFIVLALIIIPLAVQNRQIITVQLNPLALLTDAQSAELSLPLFILLILTLAVGLASGVAAGWAMARLHARKKARLLSPLDTSDADSGAPTIAPTIPKRTEMLEPRQAVHAPVDTNRQDGGDKERNQTDE